MSLKANGDDKGAGAIDAQLGDTCDTKTFIINEKFKHANFLHPDEIIKNYVFPALWRGCTP